MKINSPKSLLIVGSSSADKDGNLMVNQFGLILQQSLNNALKRGSNVGKISDTATNDQHLVKRNVSCYTNFI